MAGFVPLWIRGGTLLELPDVVVRGLDGGALELGEGTHFGLDSGGLELGEGTHFGLVTGGRVQLRLEADGFGLRAGMFFVAGEPARLEGDGQALVITRLGYQGMRQIGGPLEPRGRLQYIDGCTDTLLVCPPRLGEPCLNHLHIPPGTRQSAHTHPSDRIGVISRGQGRCWTPGGMFELRPGMGWWIPTGTLHCFHTDDEALDVIAWHPDSDFGPTDGDHPMLNRTIRG